MGIGNHEMVVFEETYGEELFEDFVQKHSEEFVKWRDSQPGMTYEDTMEQFIEHKRDEWYAFLENEYVNHLCQNY